MGEMSIMLVIHHPGHLRVALFHVDFKLFLYFESGVTSATLKHHFYHLKNKGNTSFKRSVVA